jgi:hypothetical protein
MSKSSGRANSRGANKAKEKRYAFDKGAKNMKNTLLDAKNMLVYEDKHWKSFDELNPKHIDKLMMGKSPATIMKEEGICDGVLHLTGDYVEKHHEEIMGAIHNYEKMALKKDPMNCIENIEQKGPVTMTVYTAKNQLAVHLGKKVASAFKGGHLRIQWSKQDKPVEVWWHKD